MGGFNKNVYVAHAEVTVEIDEKFFALSPHPLLVKGVEWLHREKSQDQCQFRRRLLLAIPKLIFFLPIYAMAILLARTTVIMEIAAVRLAGIAYVLFNVYSVRWRALFTKSDEGRWARTFRRVFYGKKTYEYGYPRPKSRLTYDKQGQERPLYWWLRRPITLVIVGLCVSVYQKHRRNSDCSGPRLTLCAMIHQTALVVRRLSAPATPEEEAAGEMRHQRQEATKAERLATWEAHRKRRAEERREQLAQHWRASYHPLAAPDPGILTEHPRPRSLRLWCREIKAKVCRPYARP